jgi:hypothetical protein
VRARARHVRHTVGKLGIALEVEQDVGRLDVTVQDDGSSRRRRVQEDECTRCIAHRAQPLLPRQRRPRAAGSRQERSQSARRVVVADQPVFEAAARHQRVDEAADAALVAEGEQRQQVLVPASAKQLHLAHQLVEPLLAVRAQALDCHRPQHGRQQVRVHSPSKFCDLDLWISRHRLRPVVHLLKHADEPEHLGTSHGDAERPHSLG